MGASRRIRLSESLRRAILTSGRTRYNIAQECGVSEGVLSRFVRGERDISLRTADRIAAVIGVRLVHDARQAKAKGK